MKEPEEPIEIVKCCVSSLDIVCHTFTLLCCPQ